jgi:hypothetical protein
VAGTVPATLALEVSPSAAFGSFIPGLARDYETTAAATVTSTAGDAVLSVADPSSTATGRLMNGSRSLASAVQARATNAANQSTAFAPITGSNTPLTLLTYAGPITLDAVTIALKQPILANESLRTGAYSKTLTFTLSTTTP